MNVRLNIIKIQLESLRSIMNFLLSFKSPSDKIVIFCSQQLDDVIVKYHKVTAASYKATVTDNRNSLNNKSVISGSYI